MASPSPRLAPVTMTFCIGHYRPCRKPAARAGSSTCWQTRRRASMNPADLVDEFAEPVPAGRGRGRAAHAGRSCAAAAGGGRISGASGAEADAGIRGGPAVRAARAGRIRHRRFSHSGGRGPPTPLARLPGREHHPYRGFYAPRSPTERRHWRRWDSTAKWSATSNADIWHEHLPCRPRSRGFGRCPRRSRRPPPP